MVSYIPVVGWIFALAAMIPGIAAGVRRLHDVGRCGWWLLFPIVNLVFLATEGQNFSNEYGPKPLS